MTSLTDKEFNEVLKNDLRVIKVKAYINKLKIYYRTDRKKPKDLRFRALFAEDPQIGPLFWGTKATKSQRDIVSRWLVEKIGKGSILMPKRTANKCIAATWNLDLSQSIEDQEEDSEIVKASNTIHLVAADLKFQK